MPVLVVSSAIASKHMANACNNGFRCADVTRRASQLLLVYRGMMTPPQLARLAARMAEVGMVQEINSLVDGAVTNGSHQSQAVGFVAAALTGALTQAPTFVKATCAMLACLLALPCNDV